MIWDIDPAPRTPEPLPPERKGPLWDWVIIGGLFMASTAFFLLGFIDKEGSPPQSGPDPIDNPARGRMYRRIARDLDGMLSETKVEHTESLADGLELEHALAAISTARPDLALEKELWERQDWSKVSPDWIPSPESMEYWLRLRIDQIQKIIGDDEGKAHRYGWDREWPPYEGFPTPDDYDRLTHSDLEAFELVMTYKTTQAIISDIQDRATTKDDRSKLKRLWLGYEPWIASAYDKVGIGDAYLGWNDLIRLGGRMGIE